jgi:hypothetical protein
VLCAVPPEEVVDRLARRRSFRGGCLQRRSPGGPLPRPCGFVLSGGGFGVHATPWRAERRVLSPLPPCLFAARIGGVSLAGDLGHHRPKRPGPTGNAVSRASWRGRYPQRQPLRCHQVCLPFNPSGRKSGQIDSDLKPGFFGVALQKLNHEVFGRKNLRGCVIFRHAGTAILFDECMKNTAHEIDTAVA